MPEIYLPCLLLPGNCLGSVPGHSGHTGCLPVCARKRSGPVFSLFWFRLYLSVMDTNSTLNTYIQPGGTGLMKASPPGAGACGDSSSASLPTSWHLITACPSRVGTSPASTEVAPPTANNAVGVRHLWFPLNWTNRVWCYILIPLLLFALVDPTGNAEGEEVVHLKGLWYVHPETL